MHHEPRTPDTDTTDAHDATAPDARPVNRRRMLLAGAGLAGAAALASSGTARADDPNDVTLGTTKSATDRTGVSNTGSNGGTPGTPGNEALYGEITDADNGSHAILGVTSGTGHAIAGVVPPGTGNTVAAAWGRHAGEGPGTEGLNIATDVALAGDANGVRGTITEVTNGSHAVKGVTMGAGHSVAGDTPADAEDGSGGPNTTAATWGRHGGVGAGIGGVSAAGYGGEFVGGKSSVRLIPTSGVAVGPPTDAAHLVGELFVDGNGDLYYNPAAGANFTKLNGQGGIVMWSESQRAYDSREEFTAPANSNKGRFAAGEVREIDLTEFTDLPATATGAVINLTVADTGDAGFLTVFSGDTADADRPNTSSINWTAPGSAVANGLTVPVGSAGTVKVYALQATEVIIDIAAYVS